MKKIIIFGSGDHAKVVLTEILKLKEFKFLGFCDEKKKNKVVHIVKNKKFKVIGNFKEVKKLCKKNKINGIIGIANNKVRKKIVQQTKNIKNLLWKKIISKDATLNGDVEIGEGTFISSGTIINSKTTIGKHCLINTRSSIDHDCAIDDYSGTGPGVIFGGNVKIEQLGYVGIGSIIKDGVKIGKNSFIGAGSLVLKNCEKNWIYYGSPANKIQKVID